VLVNKIIRCTLVISCVQPTGNHLSNQLRRFKSNCDIRSVVAIISRAHTPRCVRNRTASVLVVARDAFQVKTRGQNVNRNYRAANEDNRPAQRRVIELALWPVSQLERTAAHCPSWLCAATSCFTFPRILFLLHSTSHLSSSCLSNKTALSTQTGSVKGHQQLGKAHIYRHGATCCALHIISDR